MSQLEHTSQKR